MLADQYRSEPGGFSRLDVVEQLSVPLCLCRALSGGRVAAVITEREECKFDPER